MSVSTLARPSPPEDVLVLIMNGLKGARDLTALSEAARTWDALDLVAGPSTPTAHEVPVLIAELQEVLRRLVGCAQRLLAIHLKAVEAGQAGQAEETAMDDALLRAQRLIRDPEAARTPLGYLRLLAASAETIFDLAGDTP
ncbi:hypothetical protein [Streptomyces sp. NPDC051364]|uniref:hypothetical protein n=1 Tax=Streptomyces sp. NPDC051364 TaxID=3155799 RepID=UPI00342AC172